MGGYDESHSNAEDRYITISMIGETAYIVMVVYTERDDAIRLNLLEKVILLSL